NVSGISGAELDFDAERPNLIRPVHVHQYTAVSGFPDPAPFELKLIVVVHFPSSNVPIRFASDDERAFADHERLNRIIAINMGNPLGAPAVRPTLKGFACLCRKHG